MALHCLYQWCYAKPTRRAHQGASDMTTFTFDKNYKNLEQVRPLMPAFLARYDEIQQAGRYPYNDDFTGYLGITGDEKAEKTAIYLCQSLRRLDAIAWKVRNALADGYKADPAGRGKCSSIIHYGWEMGGSGWNEYRDARLVETP